MAPALSQPSAKSVTPSARNAPKSTPLGKYSQVLTKPAQSTMMTMTMVDAISGCSENPSQIVSAFGLFFVPSRRRLRPRASTRRGPITAAASRGPAAAVSVPPRPRRNRGVVPRGSSLLEAPRRRGRLPLVIHVPEVVHRARRNIHVAAAASPRLHGTSNAAAAASPRLVPTDASNAAAAASPRPASADSPRGEGHLRAHFRFVPVVLSRLRVDRVGLLAAALGVGEVVFADAAHVATAVDLVDGVRARSECDGADAKDEDADRERAGLRSVSSALAKSPATRPRRRSTMILSVGARPSTFTRRSTVPRSHTSPERSGLAPTKVDCCFLNAESNCKSPDSCASNGGGAGSISAVPSCGCAPGAAPKTTSRQAHLPPLPPPRASRLPEAGADTFAADTRLKRAICTRCRVWKTFSYFS